MYLCVCTRIHYRGTSVVAVTLEQIAYRGEAVATIYEYSCSPGFLGNGTTRVTAPYQTLPPLVKGRRRETRGLHHLEDQGGVCFDLKEGSEVGGDTLVGRGCI